MLCSAWQIQFKCRQGHLVFGSLPANGVCVSGTAICDCTGHAALVDTVFCPDPAKCLKHKSLWAGQFSRHSGRALFVGGLRLMAKTLKYMATKSEEI